MSRYSDKVAARRSSIGAAIDLAIRITEGEVPASKASANPPLPGAETVADILRAMRAKERELWSGKPPRMGCFAVALMLGAYIDSLEVAIGEAPPPKGGAR